MHGKKLKQTNKRQYHHQYSPKNMCHVQPRKQRKHAGKIHGKKPKQTNDNTIINTAPKNNCHVQPRKTANSESMRGKCTGKNSNKQTNDNTIINTAPKNMCHVQRRKQRKHAGKNTWKKLKTNKQTTIPSTIQHPWICVMCKAGFTYGLVWAAAQGPQV